MIVVVIVSYHYFKIDLVDAHCHHYWFYHSYDYCDYGWIIEIIIMFVVTYEYIYIYMTIIIIIFVTIILYRCI